MATALDAPETEEIRDSDMEGPLDDRSATGPGRPKRKMQTGVDVEALQRMFQQQTASLQLSQKQQLQSAIEGMESRSIKRLDGLERALLERMQKQEDRMNEQDVKIDRMSRDQAALLDRVAELEKRGSTAGDSTATSEKKLNTVVLGGWPKDTKRDVIVKEAADLVHRLGLQDRLEESFWSPGVRSSVALSSFHLQPGETADQLRARMVHVVLAISGTKMQVASAAVGKTHWATISKPREERLRSSHASKVRRLLHVLGVGVTEADTEYASGTVWWKDACIASVTRRMPPDAVAGKVPGSWLALRALAGALSKEVAVVEAAWEECFAS